MAAGSFLSIVGRRAISAFLRSAAVPFRQKNNYFTHILLNFSLVLIVFNDAKCGLVSSPKVLYQRCSTKSFLLKILQRAPIDRLLPGLCVAIRLCDEVNAKVDTSRERPASGTHNLPMKIYPLERACKVNSTVAHSLQLFTTFSDSYHSTLCL